MFMPTMIFFSLIGILTSGILAIKFLNFLIFQIRPSRLLTYRHGEQPWAVITGASAGIGFGYAKVLSRNGFNLVLIGHLKDELAEAKAALERASPSTKIRIIVLNARTSDYATVISALSPILELNITILINNVGGGDSLGNFLDCNPRRIQESLAINIGFAVSMTHILLPRMMTSTATSKSPMLVMNTSSMASVGQPFACLYSSSKAFVNTFSKSLNMELRAEGHENIHVISIEPADVTSQSHQPPPVPWLTNADHYAEVVLSKVGSARPIVLNPYWRHAALKAMTDAMPFVFLENATAVRMRMLKDEYIERTAAKAKQS